MTARQKARKAAQRATHALGLDSRPSRGAEVEEIVYAVSDGKRRRLNGPVIPKLNARKTSRLITRASRNANR